MTITAALTNAGIDTDAITSTPDGVVTVTDPNGSRFAVGFDGQDDDGRDWWTGTRYSADDNIEGTESWRSLDAMAQAVAVWWKI